MVGGNTVVSEAGAGRIWEDGRKEQGEGQEQGGDVCRALLWWVVVVVVMGGPVSCGKDHVAAGGLGYRRTTKPRRRSFLLLLMDLSLLF